MKDISLSRRAVMLGVAALPMAQQAVAQGRPKPVVVSSANAFNGGVNCCARARDGSSAMNTPLFCLTGAVTYPGGKTL